MAYGVLHFWRKGYMLRNVLSLLQCLSSWICCRYQVELFVPVQMIRDLGKYASIALVRQLFLQT